MALLHARVLFVESRILAELLNSLQKATVAFEKTLKKKKSAQAERSAAGRLMLEQAERVVNSDVLYVSGCTLTRALQLKKCLVCVPVARRSQRTSATRPRLCRHSSMSLPMISGELDRRVRTCELVVTVCIQRGDVRSCGERWHSHFVWLP